MTVKEAKLHIHEALSTQYPKNEIEGFIRIIFEYLKGWTPVDIVMHNDYELGEFIEDRIENIITRLQVFEPIQYIIGEARFYGFVFKVTRDTLIPRQETEELVELIIKENKQSDLRVLDVGTGSGCIAIALSRYLKFPEIDAIDNSVNAIQIAIENAKTLKAHINIYNADIFIDEPKHNHYDIIVSNPPYITEQEKKDMERNVLDYEPHSALFVPNETPIVYYDRIAKYAQKGLRNGGRLYFEINPLYAKEISQMLITYGYSNIIITTDIHHRKRFVSASKKSINHEKENTNHQRRSFLDGCEFMC